MRVYHIQDSLGILTVDVPDTFPFLIHPGLVGEPVTSPDSSGLIQDSIIIRPHHLCQFHYPVVCVPEDNGDVIFIHRRELGRITYEDNLTLPLLGLQDDINVVLDGEHRCLINDDD